MARSGPVLACLERHQALAAWRRDSPHLCSTRCIAPALSPALVRAQDAAAELELSCEPSSTQLEAAEHQARWAAAMQRGRRSRRSGRGRRPHHRPRCATLLYPCLSRPAHGRLRSVYVVVAGTSFNTDTYHQTRPYSQLCGTVHPALRSPDRATRHPHSHTRDAQTVVRTERTPLIETPGSDPCSTVPRSTAGDSRSAAACTVVGEKVVSPLQGLQRRAGRDDGQAGARGAGGPDR